MARAPKQKPQPKGLRPDDAAAEAVVEGRVKIRHVAGLDTATDRLHMYCNDGTDRAVHAKGDADERRHQLYKAAHLWFNILPAGTLLVCEEPLALSKNGRTTRLLGLAAGAIWAAHLDCRILWTWADIAAWKKSVIGNGNATKDQIEAWVRANMGLEFDPAEKDLYDAAAIMRYGEIAVGLHEPSRE